MARVNPDQPLLGSVLDRLLDTEASTSRRRSLAELRLAIRRDLEDLFNSRQRCLSAPDDLEELPSSILDYGIPDISGVNPDSEDSKEAFCRQIAEIIRVHEPRFKSVQIKVLENVDGLDRTLRFRIEALVESNSGPEPVVLDSHLDPVSRSFSVLADGNG